MASQVLFHARRITLAGTAGITGFATYKYQTDPLHVFWVSDIVMTPLDVSDNLHH